MKQQLREAILAGERALETLGEIEEKLNSAEGWGLFDLFGGGFIATTLKRSRMKDAKSLMEDARRDLRAFQRELRDVDVITDIGLEDDGVLAFTDYVFDDMFSDFLVQRKINKAQERIHSARRQVSSIVAALKNKYAQM